MAQVRINKTVTKIFSTVHRWLYQASGGRLGGKMRGAPVAILATTGRRSGKPRSTPIYVIADDGNWVGTASYSGHDVHPAWYLNLEANPEATLTVDGTDHAVRARTAAGAERDRLWAKLVDVYPDYAEYQKVTDRAIPVVVFEPR